ncbi:MAG: hypothetical protein NUW37_14610 [Planctomycetes bacterium]|nr:hypothetical protein [Planctomycetota bacterium]
MWWIKETPYGATTNANYPVNGYVDSILRGFARNDTEPAVINVLRKDAKNSTLTVNGERHLLFVCINPHAHPPTGTSAFPACADGETVYHLKAKVARAFFRFTWIHK